MVSNRLKSMSWIAWGIVAVFYAYQYILRVMPNIILPDVMNRFQIDATIFGQMSGVYYIGYSLVHIPIGIFLDRFGPKKILPICILLTVIGLLPILISENWMYPLLGRALIGIGSSAAILGAFKVIRMGFKEEHFSRMLSILVSIGLIGALYGGGPLNYIRETYGYEFLVQSLIIMGITLAVISYVLLPKTAPTPHGTVLSEVWEVLSNKKVLITCFCAGLMVGPLEGFADVWGSSFLKSVYSYDSSYAAYLPSMMFMGMCFGSVVLVLIAEKTNSYSGSIIGAGLIMFSFFILLLLKWLNSSTMFFGFILVGVCSAYQIIAIYKASTYVPERLVGITTTIANMIIMTSGYVFHSVIGAVVESFGGIASNSALIAGASVIPLTLLFGVLGFITLAILDKTKRT